MSLTVTKEEGVVTVTVTSDQESYWPPLCQILWNTCHISRRIDMSACVGGVQMLVGVLGMFLVASPEDAHSRTASKMTWLGFVVILSVVIYLVAAVVTVADIGLFFSDRGYVLEIVLTILAVLQILVNTSAVVFGMGAMNHNRNMEKEDKDPHLKEVPSSASERNM